MSVIDYVTISINRCSMPEGHLCRIDYTYHLNTDTETYRGSTRYHVACELRGKALFGEKHIGLDRYDAHEVMVRDTMPVHRGFLVECDALDERVGEDAIFIKLHLHGENGERFVAESPVVRDYF